jgi:hypothetical protein
MNIHSSRLRRIGIGLATAAVMLVALLAAPSSASAYDPDALSGTVTGYGAGVLADGVTVSVIEPNTNGNVTVVEVQADPTTGAWTSGDLPDSSFIVEFNPTSSHYRTGYFATSGTVDDSALATQIELPSDVPTGAVNAVLDNKGAASGQVIDSDGAGIPNVTVDVISVDDYSTVATGTTDADGNYRVWVDNANHSDNPSVFIHYTSADGSYQSRWSGNALDEYDAAGVGIADDQADLDPVTLPDATSITGTITDPDGNPLAGATVSAYDPNGVYPDSDEVTTDANGAYRIDGLGAIDYNLQVTAPGYFYDGTLDADLTNVSTTEVDAQLSDNAEIQGTVRDAAGVPVSGVQITVFDSDGDPVTGAQTGDDGTYAVNDLGFGDYTVEFTPADPNTANYIDETSPVVTLSKADADVTQDHVMTVGGSISGTITTLLDSTKTPEEVIVTATSTTSSFQQFIFVNPTKAAGLKATYTIPGLPAGTYTVEFDPQDDNTFASQWWKGAFSADAATTVTVTAGASTPSISDTVEQVVQPANLYVKAPADDHVNVGQTLSVAAHSHSVSVPSKLTSTYQWVRIADDESGTTTNIPKATKSTYTTVNADAGFLVGVYVTQTAKGYAPWTSFLADGSPVGNAIFTSVQKFALSGTASTGHTLTVTAKGAFSVPVTLSYFWTMNGLEVPASWSTQTVLADPRNAEATNTMLLGWDDIGNGNPNDSGDPGSLHDSDYGPLGDAPFPEDASQSSSVGQPFGLTQLLQPEWDSQRLSVEVCASDLNGLYEYYCKTLKVTIAKDLIKRVIPVVSHSSGSTLFTAAAGVWHSSTYVKGTVGLKYQWYANNGTTNTAISGATKSSFTSTAAQSGDVITVHVTGSASGYTSATTYSLDTDTAP